MRGFAVAAGDGPELGSRGRKRTDRRRPPGAALVVLLAASLVWIAPSSALEAETVAPAAPSSSSVVDPGPVPRAKCQQADLVETAEQGRISAADVNSGRAALGYTCNTKRVGWLTSLGGTKVNKYVDASRRKCAYYDQASRSSPDTTGVYVLDVTSSSTPVKTANLLTPAMLAPHESLSVSASRGLLAATLGHSTSGPGWIDIYDIATDCRTPVLKYSGPFAGLGHEATFSPDGKTYWASGSRGTLVAVDVTNPAMPTTIWVGAGISTHGVNISPDGNRAYVGDLGGEGNRNPVNPTPPGLRILDVSEVQSRKLSPTVREISFITWPEVSLPHNGVPVSIDGHPYLIEFDEYTRNSVGNFTNVYDPASPVGAARIIDIANERNPRVISNLRLEVHMPANRAGDQQNDPGATTALGGYALHYCAVPRYTDPGIVACSFFLSGLRIFDIRDPYHPKELGYFSPPKPGGGIQTNHAMSQPAFDLERGEIWYNDVNLGFNVVRLESSVWPR